MCLDFHPKHPQLLTVGLYYVLNGLFPEMNYFVRSAYVILGTFGLVAIPTWIRQGWRIPIGEMIEISSPRVGWSAVALFLSLVLCHIVFH